MTEKKKIIFIPGWLDSGEIHGYENSLAIWEKPIDFQQVMEADYLIGHSIGAALALHYREINPDLSIILVNPLISKRGLSRRWLEFIIREGTHLPRRRLKILFHIPSGVAKLIRLFRIDQLAIIKKMPKERLLIIRGKNDRHLGGEDGRLLHQAGIPVLEIAGVGHNWHKRIDAVITSYIK